ncbi:unnamed protein product [Moneuplotes crassus]|uniref:Uncharacterized protein n=1 Tax=Euplotes crassus TaxID=5936 RepID=A0AAD1XSS5_EUPCR|nr:unnamed protein product [Moneuplotes crassus]
MDQQSNNSLSFINISIDGRSDDYWPSQREFEVDSEKRCGSVSKIKRNRSRRYSKGIFKVYKNFSSDGVKNLRLDFSESSRSSLGRGLRIHSKTKLYTRNQKQELPLYHQNKSTFDNHESIQVIKKSKKKTFRFDKRFLNEQKQIYNAEKQAKHGHVANCSYKPESSSKKVLQKIDLRKLTKRLKSPYLHKCGFKEFFRARYRSKNETSKSISSHDRSKSVKFMIKNIRAVQNSKK